jgi:hypothetical protein
MFRRMRGAAIALAALGCGAADVIPPTSSQWTVALSNLPALESGRYALWQADRAGAVSALGTVDVRRGSSFSFAGSQLTAHEIFLTWEPPSSDESAPSPYRVLTGEVRNGRAELSVAGALTQGTLPLVERPGQFTMFSPSDNEISGYPSHEEAGVWLFNMEPRSTLQGDMWVRLAQLRAPWVYEGWMVRDIDTPAAIWLSYGKFTPDATGAINTRDDTGWGPFSGVLDYATAGEEEFPGDDWISNPLNLPFPAALTLPLDLRERNAQGAFRWTHLITIEPASDRGEAIGSERPFIVRPYRDPFGAGGPGIARSITYRADGVPSGQATRR